MQIQKIKQKLLEEKINSILSKASKINLKDLEY